MADQVVGQLRLQLEQELCTDDDLPRLVGCRMVPGEPALISMPDDLGCTALLKVAQRDGVDGRVALVQQHHPAAKLDDAFSGDVNAVVAVAPRAAHLEVVAGLESAFHALTLPKRG
jgi:hypothetical protein